MITGALKTDNISLKKFGFTMAVAFLVIAGIVFLKRREPNLILLGISALFFILSVLFPQALKIAYLIWMKFAFVLGWINTRIILFIVFYLVFTPIGLILRIFRDPLDRKIDKLKASYWIKKEIEPFSKLNYQRQF